MSSAGFEPWEISPQRASIDTVRLWLLRAMNAADITVWTEWQEICRIIV